MTADSPGPDRTPDPLTEVGRAEVDGLASAVAGIAAAFTALRRAVETIDPDTLAAVLAAHHKDTP